MDLHITVKKKSEAYYVVAPVGSVDSDTYQELDKKLDSVLRQKVKAVMMDMSGVAYISSVGISAIFTAKEALEARGGILVLCALQPNIKKIFDALKAIPGSIFDTPAQAEAHLQAAGMQAPRERA